MSNINCFRRRSKHLDYPNQEETVIPNEIIKELNNVNLISFGSHLTILADDQVISFKDEKLCDKYLQFERIYLVHPVHHSLCYGKKNCFRIITKEDLDYGSVIFSCLSEQNRNNQIKELLEQTKVLNNQFMVEETSVHLVIHEARNLSTKNKYYCELKLDDIVYARTTVKKMHDMLIWCEKFDLKGLPKINLISVTIWKLANPKDKNQSPQIVSHVNISTEGIDRYTVTEKWYSPSPILKPSLTTANPLLKFSASCDLDNTPDQAIKPSNVNTTTSSSMYNSQPTTIIRDTAPLLRIACRYFPLLILPVGCYSRLLCFLQDQGCEFLRSIELLVTAKFREELVRPIVQLASYNSVFHSVHNSNNTRHHQYWIESLIAQLVCSEAGKNDINLILRGNSMGSKAIECFLKIECQQYLELILSETIQEVQKNYLEMEIDPARLMKSKSSSSTNTKSIPISVLKKRQRRLEIIVSKVLRKIFESVQFIPSNVLRVFNEIRRQILVTNTQNNQNTRMTSNNEEYINKVVSGCFFLRLVCPAIMTPYLFNLLPDYSENREVHRAFTLVAKSVQNVANFASIDEMKEEYMKEMVLYCRQHYSRMSDFLSALSTAYNHTSNTNSGSINRISTSYHGDMVGYESSRLCHHLEYVMTKPKFNSQRSPLELEMLDIINEIRKQEYNASTEQVDTIDKIKHNIRQQVFSNYKQLEMSTKSSGYFSTLNGSHSGGLSNIDSLFRAQQSENNTTTDLLELEKQKLDIIRGMSETYRFSNDFDVAEQVVNKSNVPLNVDEILESKYKFLSYMSYASAAISNCFNTEYLRDNHEQLVQIMKSNSEIQICMMKNLNN